jgi:hypothetical protein
MKLQFNLPPHRRAWVLAASTVLTDEETRVRNRCILTVLVCSLLIGLSPLAADPLIRRGIDVFTTPADGRTVTDFSQHPIPAGFFCNRSKAFTGRVALKGLPLATAEPGQLWGGDTVVERLHDAAFNAQGVAVTGLQFRALSLASIHPIKTACGAYHVYVSLAGQQRVTRMSIQRTQDEGGTFTAPLAINARIAFIPVKPGRNKGARKLELTNSINFPATPIPWSFAPGTRTKSIGSVLVDTDGDLVPDTRLPGTSNFSPGRSAERANLNKFYQEQDCPCNGVVCHQYYGDWHCVEQTAPSYCPQLDC